MTEKWTECNNCHYSEKRYFITGYGDVVDRVDRAVYLTIESIVKTMNEQHEQIQALKLELELNKPLFSRRELETKLKEQHEENEQLKKELKEFKDYVFSDEKILCYSCVNCISKGIYEVECYEKGKVDVHGRCFLYWKNELQE